MGDEMTAVLDSIRRVVAEDAAHAGTTHEVYLTEATLAAIRRASPYVRPMRPHPPTVLGLPCHPLKGADRRDCIATIRRGQVISVTNL